MKKKSFILIIIISAFFIASNFLFSSTKHLLKESTYDKTTVKIFQKNNSLSINYSSEYDWFDADNVTYELSEEMKPDDIRICWAIKSPKKGINFTTVQIQGYSKNEREWSIITSLTFSENSLEDIEGIDLFSQSEINEFIKID